MGSLEAMTKGSDVRYLGDTIKLKVAQGVVGAVADKGSVLRFIPYTMQAVKQGFQDLGASSLQSAHDLLRSESLRLEVCMYISRQMQLQVKNNIFIYHAFKVCS